ncbi:MAG: hypothetical protein PHS93_08415 [Candidatus Omnitrophica bacterium]|nr:hypothetical protein [Candidatus Omnitrophota bacterium]MDD5353166.1 hypothetical protein [Candidatus Omnitrophota bacterium]MDD5551125.1 hypothetical protein [Candidatus Omnitrophota bacterium]
MPIICWGNLAKSADDTQRIEQSIQDYVENHNDNENAHQVYGSSLYMHRFESLLDHQFGSVDFRYLSLNKILIMSCFESMDGWETSGFIEARILGTRFYTGSTIHDTAVARAQYWTPQIVLTFAKNPFFQTTACFISDTFQLAYLALGDPLNEAEGEGFGFKISNGNLYAFTIHGGSETTEQITGIDITEAHVYRAYMDSGEGKIYFYVDGVLRSTFSSDLPTGDCTWFIYYYIETTTNGSRSFYLADLLFMQDR